MAHEVKFGMVDGMVTGTDTESITYGDNGHSTRVYVFVFLLFRFYIYTLSR